jgi:hypothetical protein
VSLAQASLTVVNKAYTEVVTVIGDRMTSLPTERVKNEAIAIADLFMIIVISSSFNV